VTPRERVLLAIAHRKTDRAPADYAAIQEVTDRLMAHLGVADQEELLQALGVDLRRIDMDYGQPWGARDADGYQRDMWGARHREVDGDTSRPYYIPPFDEHSTVDDVHANAWPDPAAVDVSAARARCEKYYGTYATFGAPWSPFFHEVGWIVGQQDFYEWLGTKPDVMAAIIDHVVDYEVAVSRRYFEACRGVLDIAFFGNDFGTQRSLFISPAMWHRFFRGPLKRFYDAAHDFGCKVMQHSCGAVRDIIPPLIEDGVDILDPIQIRADGMAFDGLVDDFGGRLTLHGAVDTQHTLPFGSEADVRAQVRSYLDRTREGGGYILCSSQHLIEDIPTANILGMYDENLKAA
jgi:uroporphyrinogen decarboxylase